MKTFFYFNKTHIIYNMSLLVPPRFREDINSYSHTLQNGTKYAQKSVKGLFLAPENKKYLEEQIYSLITHVPFIDDTIDLHVNKLDYFGSRRDLGIPTTYGNVSPASPETPMRQKGQRAAILASEFRPRRKLLSTMVDDFVEGYLLPYPDEMSIENTIMQLHHINKKFITETARNIIQTPNLLIHDYFDINPDTGLRDVGSSYDYKANAYSSGVWQPEKLFTDSQRNRENPYWVPLQVNFHVGRDNTNTESLLAESAQPSDYHLEIDQPGISEGPVEGYSNYHRSANNFNSKAHYNIKNVRRSSKHGHGKGPGHRYSYDHYGGKNAAGETGFRKGGKFPGWQFYPQYRHYERNTGESLAEGGWSDRRVQGTRGYNMTALLRKPSLGHDHPSNPAGDSVAYGRRLPL